MGFWGLEHCADSAETLRKGMASDADREPCMTRGLVPGAKEIKGSVLGRLRYYYVW